MAYNDFFSMLVYENALIDVQLPAASTHALKLAPSCS